MGRAILACRPTTSLVMFQRLLGPGPWSQPLSRLLPQALVSEVFPEPLMQQLLREWCQERLLEALAIEVFPEPLVLLQGCRECRESTRSWLRHRQEVAIL